MDAFEVRVVGDKDAAAAIAEAGLRVQMRAPVVLQHYGQLYQTRVRAAASGRPGPRVVTGDYRRSITMEMAVVDGLPSAIVGTVSPQGRRLEYGYVDTDALGRHVNAPPYPHFEPPLAATVDELAEALADLVTDDGVPG